MRSTHFESLLNLKCVLSMSMVNIQYVKSTLQHGYIVPLGITGITVV